MEYSVAEQAHPSTRPSRPHLSIVIPAYNEEHRLPESLQAIVEFTARQPYSVEVVVVDNNSDDGTAAVIADYAAEFPFVHGLFEGTQGKGAAVKRGMLAAQGHFRFICDADLSMPIDEVNKFFPLIENGFDIAIGSREAPGAQRYDEPSHRHIMGRVFNTIVRLLAIPKLQDTQCGFKMFTATATERLFPLQTMNGWSFDVEILYAARLHGFRVVEVPINWFYKATDHIHPIRDSIDMFLEVLKIRLKGRQGYYQPRPNPNTTEHDPTPTNR